MLCVFQVNHGEFLTISDEIQPTSRIHELTVSLSRNHKIPEDKQVLLTHEGRLLENHRMIGEYGVGTETMPILLYDMSLIKGETHRQPLVVAELAENYSQALEVMRQTNSDMRQQITLAKKLATSCDVLSEKCVKVVKEQELQLQGWSAAIANSNTVLESFIQQVQILKESNDNFIKSKVAYQGLIDNFPMILDQLKQMVIPNQLQGEHNNSHTVTLLDWIGTHDQSSTLSELAKECRSALESQGGKRIQGVISDAESAIESIPDQSKALEGWKSKMLLDDRGASLKRVCTLAEEAKDFVKKLVATSERALKSGDKLVVKELTMSNWKTLSMMSKQHSEIQSLVNDCIMCKEQLTSELNQQLRLVSEIQTKVSDSERHIPLMKERIRRITHRFTILGQISEAPKVLAMATAEIIRRRRFHEQFVKLTEETCEYFGKVRNTEIKAREKFLTENGKHFLAQLFHQALNDRPPNINSPLRRQFDQQLPEISKEEVHQVLTVVSSELQQQLKSAKNFTLEHCTSVMNTQDEVDSSMYTSASDNDHLVKEILKLEIENRQYEQEVEQLQVDNKKLVDSVEALERKVDNLEEEKMAEVRRLEKQVEDMAEQLSKSEKLATEEKADISSKLEEKNKALLDATRKELEEYKLLVKEKDQLLQKQIIEFKKQELKISELIGAQEAIVKEKDALLDSQAKNIVELTNKLKMSTENIEHERSQRSATVSNKQSLEESLKELKAELSQEKATCELLKSKLETSEKERLDQLKSVQQENLELSRAETEMRQQLLELQSMISNLRDEKVQVIAENSSLNDTMNKLRIEMKEKAVQISSLEVSLMDLNHQLLHTNEQRREMEENYKNQLADKEKVVIELTKLEEGLNEKLQTETSKLNSSEQNVNKLTALLKELKENETQLKENIVKLETNVKEKNDKIDAVTLQLKEAKESVALANAAQMEKITQYENEILQIKETSNIKVDTLSSQVREYVEKFERQAEKITQYESDVFVLKETNSKELKQKEAVIVEKQEMIEKLKEQNSVLENDVNKWQKKCMEAERDLKEEQRLEKTLSGRDMYSSTSSHSREMIESNAIVPSLKIEASSISVALSVQVCNLLLGDYALFMPDRYGNYLAITVDSKIYYLDKKSSSAFTMYHELPSKSKFLIGKISSRQHCEVKKDGNRLRVPMGSKVYRLTADEWRPPS